MVGGLFSRSYSSPFGKNDSSASIPAQENLPSRESRAEQISHLVPNLPSRCHCFLPLPRGRIASGRGSQRPCRRRHRQSHPPGIDERPVRRHRSIPGNRTGRRGFSSRHDPSGRERTAADAATDPTGRSLESRHDRTRYCHIRLFSRTSSKLKKMIKIISNFRQNANVSSGFMFMPGEIL